MRTPVAAAVTALLLSGLSGCGGETSGHPSAEPSFDLPAFPTSWSDTIDNPYLPLVPGTTYVYRSTSDEGVQRDVVTVTRQTRVVDGVTAVVVHDQVTSADGELLEDTYDWYAQDADGNVWYLGEDTKAYDGKQVDTEGSWEAGVDGAKAGIAMLAHPEVGAAYQQELYAGEAEDRGKVVSVDEKVSGPFGSWDGVLMTEDTTPLEPELVENKYYARGIGVVQEAEVSGGDGERVVLVDVRKR